MQKIKETIRCKFFNLKNTKNRFCFSLVIASVVNSPTKFKKSEVKQIIEKLDKCYNIDNDPRSDEYKKKRLEQFQTLTDYEARNLVKTSIKSFLFIHLSYLF
jgi:hypothetical protein